MADQVLAPTAKLEIYFAGLMLFVPYETANGVPKQGTPWDVLMIRDPGHAPELLARVGEGSGDHMKLTGRDLVEFQCKPTGSSASPGVRYRTRDEDILGSACPRDADDAAALDWMWSLPGAVHERSAGMAAEVRLDVGELSTCRLVAKKFGQAPPALVQAGLGSARAAAEVVRLDAEIEPGVLEITSRRSTRGIQFDLDAGDTVQVVVQNLPPMEPGNERRLTAEHFRHLARVLRSGPPLPIPSVVADCPQGTPQPKGEWPVFNGGSRRTFYGTQGPGPEAPLIRPICPFAWSE